MGINIKHKNTGDVLLTVAGENLQNADLRYADLRYADLRYADLRYADLQGANLRHADLQGADLQGADLRCSDLRHADLDFSCWPLWCGSFGVKADDRLVAQLFCHWARLDVSSCSPHIKYMHRFITTLFGKSMANWFCKYRDDVKKI